jgi:hypothetical protein
MKLWLLSASLAFAFPALADVSLTASVDQSRVALGESITFTIAVNGTQSSPAPAIPKVAGLNFAGPAVSTSVSILNGAMNQSVNLSYQVTPTHTGEITIPPITVAVAGQSFETQAIKLTVLPPNTQADLQQSLFVRVQLDAPQVYLGQTAPLNVILFSRANVPLKNISGFTYDADGLGFKFLNNLKSGTKVINGETFNIFVIEGAISPTRTGQVVFGSCVVKTQLAVQKQNRSDDFFDNFLGRTPVREQPVTAAAVPIEVLPLPVEGRPADFTGAVGQWNLEVTAKPTEVTVGDPITLTMKITGNGNIDTVATPQIKGLDNFKTYDPTSKTTKNELSTTGERVFQQVLIPKSTEVKELPEVRLSFFDPAAKAYRTAVQGPVKLLVKAGGPGAVVSGGLRARPAEKLGEDIVYLKGDLGPVEASVSWGTVWLLNVTPVLALAGAIGWKRRRDRLRGDVAYARRSRAARQARRRLDGAGTLDDVLRTLQSYLGDRLNIPASGITMSVVDERQLPGHIREIFEACDAARFAGVPTDVAALKQQVEQVIDDLERNSL